MDALHASTDNGNRPRIGTSQHVSANRACKTRSHPGEEARLHPCLAQHLGPFAITANCIVPGVIATRRIIATAISVGAKATAIGSS
jgi:hypothetical protein